ncbi:MAG: CesT family type III secretion system chaperone [Parachlamydiaceae bacterium]|nr:CesT family type III secretion system chaperone [Parachlamydiaceae bacterium]
MLTNQFEAILKDLEGYFKCQLNPDSNNSCLIQLDSGIQVQIEEDLHHNLIIGVKLGMLPPGRYQETLLKAALKANGYDPLSHGILGFAPKSNTLILFQKIEAQHVKPMKLITVLTPFLEKARLWSESIQRGDIPHVGEGLINPSNPPNLFGLMR